MDSMENIEAITMTTGEEISSWPVVESVDLGFSESIEPGDSSEEAQRFLHMRLHHHLIDVDEITTTTYAMQPGVVEEIIAGVCAANTQTMEDADELFSVILGAVKFFREGNNLREDNDN